MRIDIRAYLVILATVSSSLYACSDCPIPQHTVEAIRERGRPVVLTRDAPTTYYQERDRLAGLEYEMATAFANSAQHTSGSSSRWCAAVTAKYPRRFKDFRTST